MSLVPSNWTCQSGDEVCHLEIEHDRLATDGPLVVTLYAQHHDGTDDHTTLCCASPQQAREMAAALLVYAHFAEQQNAES